MGAVRFLGDEPCRSTAPKPDNASTTPEKSGRTPHRRTARRIRSGRPLTRPPLSGGVLGQARRVVLDVGLDRNRVWLSQQAGQPARPGQQHLGLGRHVGLP